MQRNKISFGKILVFLSFFIIIIGALISIGETTGYVDTSNNIIVPHSDDKITITTTENSGGLVVNDDGLIVNSDDTGKSSNVGDNGGENVNPSNPNTPTGPTYPTPTQPVEPQQTQPTQPSPPPNVLSAC